MTNNISDNTMPSTKEMIVQLSKLTFSAILFGVVATYLLIEFSWLGVVGCIAASYAIYLPFRQIYLMSVPK